MAVKRRSRSVSLKGVAAKAFVEMHTGVRASSEDDVLIRLATLVHMDVATGNMDGAVGLLKDALAQARVDARKAYHGFVTGMMEATATAIHAPQTHIVEPHDSRCEVGTTDQQESHEAVSET